MPVSTMICGPPSSFVKQYGPQANVLTGGKRSIQTASPLTATERLSNINNGQLLSPREVTVSAGIFMTASKMHTQSIGMPVVSAAHAYNIDEQLINPRIYHTTAKSPNNYGGHLSYRGELGDLAGIISPTTNLGNNP